nr:hypothetical protein [uncultured Kingella sp.]
MYTEKRFSFATLLRYAGCIKSSRNLVVQIIQRFLCLFGAAVCL